MISKVIHQIWLGPKKMPTEWMDTWKTPKFEVRVWREADIEKFNLLNKDKYNFYMQVGDYAGAADVARVEILYRLGGVYMDADSVRLLDISELLRCDFVACLEYDDRVANGFMGCTIGHPIMEDYIQRIERATVLQPPCFTIGGTMLTSCIDSYGRGKVSILPQHAFYPKWHRRKQYKGKIYARHMWGTTKGLYEEV